MIKKKNVPRGEWETIQYRIGNNVDTMSERLAVPGGWIYRTIVTVSGGLGGPSVSVVKLFIPDEKEQADNGRSRIYTQAHGNTTRQDAKSRAYQVEGT